MTNALVFTNIASTPDCRPFVEVRLVATVMKSIALVQSGLISVLLEPNGATQEARFSSYCRLLPPRPIAKLLQGIKMTGAGDGNRTHVRSLGSLQSNSKNAGLAAFGDFRNALIGK
jgi:hypothetical protein